MRSVSASDIKDERVIKTKSSRNHIKLIIAKIVKADILDIDNILESKDWPYLWRK